MTHHAYALRLGSGGHGNAEHSPRHVPLDVAAIAAYTAGVMRAVRANRARRLPPTPWPDCGTDTAYHRHTDAHEHTCEPCRVAHNAYNRAARKSTP